MPMKPSWLPTRIRNSRFHKQTRNKGADTVVGKDTMSTKKHLTLADVAAQAGVSKMTASRALRGDDGVSQRSLEKVQAAAAELGYAGNHLAASLSGKQSDLIGVVVPSFANIVFAEALSGITEVLAGKRTQPVFGVTDYDADREYEVLRNMLSWRPLGLIVTGVEQTEQCRGLLSGAGIPIVQIMDTDAEPIDSSVGLSHIAAGYDMAQALLSRGRRRFGFIGRNLHKDHRGVKRRTGFQNALKEQGLDYVKTLQESGPTTVEAGRRMTQALFAQAPDLDAIYYTSDDMAHGGLCYFMEIGVAVPDQIAMIGFNNLNLVGGFPGRIATSDSARRYIGQKAAELILESIASAAGPLNRKVVISPQIDLGLLGDYPKMRSAP